MIDPSILVEPVTEITRSFLIYWVVIPIVFMLCVASIVDYVFDIETEMDDIISDMSFSERILLIGVTWPIGEELVFRIVPHWFGIGPTLLIVWNIVWLVLHGARALFLIPIFFAYLKLGLGGAYEALIALHIGQNVFMMVLYQISE